MANKKSEQWVDKDYDVDWSNPTEFITVGHRNDIPLPKKPPYNQMINFGLPKSKQKFTTTEIPKSLLKRKLCTPEEDAFIKREYHRIHNGIWILIDGTPVYITGDYYFFLNYWTTHRGVRPSFRYVQAQVFLFWEYCVREKDCYGMFLVKPRRVGGTEMTIAIEYITALKFRNMVCGMQSKNEDSVYKNYQRIIKSHKKMIWFMKPINQGSSENANGLFFKYPVERISKASLGKMTDGQEVEEIYTDPEIGSEITYQATVATAYDGERLDRFILNEFGKIEKVSALDIWDKVKPCLHVDGGITITGKAMFESTIEEISDDQIQEMIDLWDDSDEKERDDNNRTTSGLYRLFLNALDTSKEDEYGFPMVEQQKKFLESQFRNLEEKGKRKELINLKRKNPIFIEDVLTPSGDQTAFNKEKLTETLNYINFPPSKEFENMTVRGNFAWYNGIKDSQVVFDHDPDGRWEVSQLTFDGIEISKMMWLQGKRIPPNTSKFRKGVDPYDHKETMDSRKSKGASVVLRMFDHLIDGDKYETNGAMSSPSNGGLYFHTDQPISTYLYRHDDPELFYEDMLMEAVYFGTPVLVENNKPGLMRHFERRGYEKYIMNRPKETMSNKDGKVTEGIAASENTIGQYFDQIASYVMNMHNAIKHKDLVVQLLAMNRKNVSKMDLGVAFGWTLLARIGTVVDYSSYMKESVEVNNWFDYNYV